MRILYFAYLVDKLGRASEELTLPDGVRTAGALLGLLRARGGIWPQALADDQVQVLVNRAFVSLEDPVAPGDEVAIVSKTRG
jgi:molybdopterin converting factor small subunit